jgi:xylulokinase
VTEAGAFGAALLAGFAAGVYDSLESAARPDGASERVFEPEPAVVAVYEEVYERYLRLHELATDFTRELNAWKESSRSPQG